MSAIPPLPPGEDEPAPPRTGEFAPAPWGVTVTILGTIGSVLVVFTVLMFLLTFLHFFYSQAELEKGPVAVRYSTLIVGELALVIVPFGIARSMRARRGALGLVRAPVRALAEAPAIGLFLWGVTEGYGWLAEQFWPHAGERIAAESASQRAALEGPVPLLILTAVFVAPFAEELFFRGFVFGGLRGRLGFTYASGLSAALFAASHWMLWSTVPLFIIGLACAVAYERHRSLLAPLAIHMSFNALSLVLPSMTVR